MPLWNRELILKRHSVKVTGHTGPLVVLAHGFGSDKTVWNHVLPRLSNKFRVLTFNLIGANGSSSEHYEAAHYNNLGAYTNDLLSILAAMDIQECQYVGHSVSGMIGALASIRAPHFFRKLIMMGTSPCYKNLDGYHGGFDQSDISNLVGGMAASYAEWVKSFAPSIVSASPESPAAEEFSAGLLAMRPDIALSLLLVILGSDHRADLSKITTPSVILQTRDDLAVPLSVAEYMRDNILGAQLQIIDAKGHLPHLSAPDLVSDALLRHLERSDQDHSR